MTAKRELPACPVEITMMLISDKWKVLILRDLLNGTLRFSELRRSVGNVSQKVLTSNLRQMERDGLVHREVYPEVPPRVEYSLTEVGESLRPIIEAMKTWGTITETNTSPDFSSHWRCREPLSPTATWETKRPEPLVPAFLHGASGGVEPHEHTLTAT